VTRTIAAARTTATAIASRHLGAALLAAALGAAACGQAAEPAPGQRQATAAPSAAALATVLGATAGALSRVARVSLTLSGGALFGAPGSRVSGTGAFDFGALDGALTFATPGSGTSEPVVFTATAVYVRPAAGGGLLPAGKTWTVADFKAPESLTSSFPQLIAQTEAVNPAFTLSELLWGAVAAAAAGHDRAGGQDADRYTVTLDLDRALTGVTGPAGVPFSRALATELVALGGTVGETGRSTTLRATVWVASTGRLARVAVAPPGVNVGTVTMDLTAFAGPVHADPPPAAQVVDVLELGPNGERENANGGDADGG
jgi:hypothetical protein